MRSIFDWIHAPPATDAKPRPGSAVPVSPPHSINGQVTQGMVPSGGVGRRSVFAGEIRNGRVIAFPVRRRG